MKKLEQERDAFMEKLAPEDQQEYQKKKDEYTQHTRSSHESSSHTDIKQ